MNKATDPFAQYVWQPSRATVRAVANNYGTPSFVYSASHLRATYGDLTAHLDSQIEVFYSLKANPCLGIAQALVDQGAGCEVSSAGELYAAQRVGGSQKGILFVGPGKNDSELEAVARDETVTLVCESLSELSRFDDVLAKRGVSGQRKVLLRVNPSFKNKGSKLSMGGKPRQFGVDEARLHEAGKEIKALNNVRVVGFHAYMGTRILDHETIRENTSKLLTLYENLAKSLQFELEIVDIGGGFGVPYYEDEVGLAPKDVAITVNDASRAFRDRNPATQIIVELGRYLTAGAGVLLVSVVDIKESRGKVFAVADGGTNVHMAANGLGSFAMKTFPIVAYSEPGGAINEYTVTGPLCTPNDVLAKNIRLGRLSVGDQAAVLMSGAYGASASPTGFLSHGQPAEVMIDESGEIRCLVSRPTVDELFRRHHVA